MRHRFFSLILSFFAFCQQAHNEPVGNDDRVRIIVDFTRSFRSADVSLYFDGVELATTSIHGSSQNQAGFLIDDERFTKCQNFDVQKTLFSLEVNNEMSEIKQIQCIWPLVNP